MNSFIKFSSFLLIIFLIISCDKDPIIEDPTGNLLVRYVALYNGVPMQVAKDYKYVDGELDIRFQNFEFYLSNLGLTSNNTNDISELKEIDLIRFEAENANEEMAATGQQRLYKDIPVGEYSGLSFGIGVPSDLNNSDTEYDVSEPLGKNFWQGWQSFIFAKIEGVQDVNENGEFENDISEKFILHTGSNAAFRTATINKEISITSDNTKELIVEIEMADIFLDDDNNSPFDIQTNNTTHNPEQLEAGMYIMDNLATAIKAQ